MEKGAKMRRTVVLYPGGGGIGHVGPMTELAKVFLGHGYDVTMLLIEPPIKSTDFNESIIRSMAASNPSISFHVLPPIPPPDFASSTKHPFLLVQEFMPQYNDELQSFLRSIPRDRFHSLVVDMFCVHAIDVAFKLGIPVYTFFTSCAGVLAVQTQMPALLAGRRAGLKELGDTPLDFLGVPPMPASHLMRELLGHPEEEPCRTMMGVWKRNTDTHGVLINTFESMESRAVKALKDNSLCVPPIYCVGPLVSSKKMISTKQDTSSRHECLGWLDAQPERGVVLLCWGSNGLLSEEQLKEIAVGLDNSRQRFLWVVRTPPGDTDDPKRFLEQRPEPDLNVLLPEGFLDRTKDRGLVVKSWLPQVAVLNHPAVGAFVTHCGWNSTLESIVAGVPMLCWPLGAEQKMNKVLMTMDVGIAVEMAGYNTGFVKAEEVEAKVRLMMESREGKEIRKRAVELKNEAHKALEDGGSSQTAFLQFLEDVKNVAN